MESFARSVNTDKQGVEREREMKNARGFQHKSRGKEKSGLAYPKRMDTDIIRKVAEEV